MKNEYWSKEAYKERVKGYDTDIKYLRKCIPKIDNNYARTQNRNLLKALIQSKKIHAIRYKIIRREEKRKRMLF